MLEKLTKKELIKIANENNITVNSKMKKANLINAINKALYMKKRKEVKKDLLDQLEKNEVIGEFYIDLVNDYMAMWDVKNKLIDDIKEKGVSIKYQNGENQWGYKKNDSVGELQRTNNQMLKLLEHLGLKPKQDKNNIDYSNLEM